MQRCIRLAHQAYGLTGWRRNIAAFAFGALATLTLAPFFIFPLIIPAFTGLYWLVDAAPSRQRAFWDGWWWAWGFYMSGLYWFCIALLTDAEKFAWLIPFALFGLTGVIALYSGVACWLMSFLRVRGLTKIFVFSVVWTCVEYARGHLFTGFPWNLAGYSFNFTNATLQMASLVGVYGLTWFAGCSARCPLSCARFGIPAHGALPARYMAYCWSPWLVWGAWRLQEANHIPESERYVPGVMLRLVQANIAQPHKWDPKLQMQGLQEHIRLTQTPGLENVTHVIWPETAVPYAVEAGTPLAHMLGSTIPPGKILITGVLRDEGDEQDWQIWNSLVAIDHDGRHRRQLR